MSFSQVILLNVGPMSSSKRQLKKKHIGVLTHLKKELLILLKMPFPFSEGGSIYCLRLVHREHFDPDLHYREGGVP